MNDSHELQRRFHKNDENDGSTVLFVELTREEAYNEKK
jgi:hypothetical protein